MKSLVEHDGSESVWGQENMQRRLSEEDYPVGEEDKLTNFKKQSST
jgi:hypothetical protein